MTDLPGDLKKIKARLRSYERRLAQEKQKFGSYDDGAGKRYVVGPLYLLLGDLDGAVKSFAWYEKHFPDDSGEAGHYLCWSLTFLRSGKGAKAEATLRRAMFADRYVLPKLLELDADAVGVRPDRSGLNLMSVEGIPDAYLALWKPEERDWASALFLSAAWVEMRARYFELESLLETEPRGARRTALVEELFGLKR